MGIGSRESDYSELINIQGPNKEDFLFEKNDTESDGMCNVYIIKPPP